MRRLLTLLGVATAALLAPLSAFAQSGKIGIFDLDYIHSLPLNPEIVDKQDADGVTTERIRFQILPGIKAMAFFSYPSDKTSLPTTITILNSGKDDRRKVAAQGFAGFYVMAPTGNTDPSKEATVGGAKASDTFVPNPQNSWLYQYVVANVRGLDYLATRREVDMKRVVVTGFSYSGVVAALMHAIDNRPCAYETWNSTGYFADAKGISGDKPSMVTRDLYEKYCPSNYAQYGTSPIFIGNSITDYFATLDGAILMYQNLKCPKEFSWAPNRYHADTSRHEYLSAEPYAWQFQGNGPKTLTMHEGAFTVTAGKLYYHYYVDAEETLNRTEVLYSYGAPGHWVGRTWHRMEATATGDGYTAEIPVYDPNVPVYVVGQVEGPVSRVVGNCPQLYIPRTGGVTTATAAYPNMILDFEDQSDLYFGSGDPEFVGDAAQGQYAASVTPFGDDTVHILNIEPFLWSPDAKELHFFLKGDGRPGPVNLYLVRDSRYDLDKANRTTNSFVQIVKPNETFAEGWHEYAIPLSRIRDLKRVDSLWFETPGRKLVIDGVQVK